MRRRRYLALLGTATIGGLAGCSGANSGEEGTTGTEAAGSTSSTPTATGTTGESTTTTTTRTETGTPTRTETETPTETETGRATTAETAGESTTGSQNGTTAAGTGGSGDVRTVEVGPNGQYVYEPGTSSPLEVPVGTTVEWVWRSDNHNIVVGEQPAEANWEGTPGGANELYNSGYTYTHTFETAGQYNYWCSPHRSLGMVADVVVTDSG